MQARRPEPAIKRLFSRLKVARRPKPSVRLDGTLSSTVSLSRDRVAEYRAADLRTFAPGDLLSGRFRILRFLGEGGMGEVYAAEDRELHERVALKTLRPAVSGKPELIARFKREVQLARKVTHRNVCRLFDLFRHEFETGGSIAFLTMELLDGNTLAQHIRQTGPMKPAEARSIVEQVLAGLMAAHDAGIVHRDLKSGNIMLATQSGGGIRAVITDFGLAGEDEVSTANLGAGAPFAVRGTPAYMAPEQVSGGAVTTSADLYAFGIMLFEMVTGRLPFSGTDAWDTAVKRLKQPPPSPRQYAPDLDRRWNAAILACLALEPGRRPQSAREVLTMLGPRRLDRRFVAAGLVSTLLVAGGMWIETRPRAINIEAQKSFKRGEEFAKRRTQDALNNAVQEYSRAVRIEPQYTEALVGLADAYSAMANFGFMDPSTALLRAKQAALEAVRLDRRSGRATGVLAYCISIDVHHWLEAEPYFKRAVALAPKDPEARLWYSSWLGRVGKSDEAIAQIKAGLDQSPSLPTLLYQLATQYLFAGQLNQSYEEAKELVRLQPFDDHSYLALARALDYQGRYGEALNACTEAAKYRDTRMAQCFRASALAGQGRLAEAKEIARAVEAYWKQESFETELLAALFCRIGDAGKAIQMLGEGYARNDSSILWAPVDPVFASVHEDPAFRSLVRKIGLDPERFRNRP